MTLRVAALVFAAAFIGLGQPYTQRGFFENFSTFYPQAAPNDDGRAVSMVLLRYEAGYEVLPWLKLNASFDATTDTHRQVERAWDVSLDDRTIRRPAFSVRRLSALITRGRFTIEAGRQFIRWGRADILNPVDRFAPKDFLNVVNTEFLGVIAARATYESGSNTVDLVWQPWFTPSRTPLINQRWTVLPEQASLFRFRDLGADYPSRHQFGARWNHVGRGYEFAASYFDGFNHLPLLRASLRDAADVDVERWYPRLRLYGFDAAVPTRWATVKGEAAYFTTSRSQTDEYLLYVIQLERQQGEWIFAGGYAGEYLTEAAANPFQFSPERGFAKSFLGTAQYTISPTRTFAVSAAVRQNGDGSWLRGEYSQTFGRHWRATAGFTWIRGDAADFLGQYHRNSYGSLALRYSF